MDAMARMEAYRGKMERKRKVRHAHRTPRVGAPLCVHVCVCVCVPSQREVDRIVAESKRTVQVPSAPPGTREYKREMLRLQLEEKKRIRNLLQSKIGEDIKLADFLDGGRGPGKRRKLKKLKLRRQYGLPGREDARDIGTAV